MWEELLNFIGVIIGLSIFIFLWLVFWLSKRKTAKFEFDAKGEKGAFEKLLTFYLDIAKLGLTLASGSIALLAGSSAFRASGNLPTSVATPLYLLTFSIAYGIAFMAPLSQDYESYRHETSDYKPFSYSRNLALGYGSLTCFFLGYFWLIFSVTHH